MPKGKSWLGGGGGKPGEKEVVMARDFYLGKYEVTQEEWEKVTGLTPSRFLTHGRRREHGEGHYRRGAASAFRWRMSRGTMCKRSWSG